MQRMFELLGIAPKKNVAPAKKPGPDPLNKTSIKTDHSKTSKAVERKEPIIDKNPKPTTPQVASVAAPSVKDCKKEISVVARELPPIKKIHFTTELENKDDASIVNYFKPIEEFKNKIFNTKQEFRYKNYTNIWISQAPKTPDDLYLLAVAINFERDMFGMDAKPRAINKDPLPVTSSFTDEDLYLNKYYGNVITENRVNHTMLVMNLLNDAACRGHKESIDWLNTLQHSVAETDSHIKAQKWLAALQKAREISLAQGSDRLLSPSELKDAMNAQKKKADTQTASSEEIQIRWHTSP